MKTINLMLVLLLIIFTTRPDTNLFATDKTVFTGEGADDTTWMNMLTMVAIGAAARGMSACKTTSYDAMGAAASGGIYLWGELSTLKSSKGMESKSYTYKLNQDGTLVDSDKTALTAMRKNYVDARSNLESKKSMQKYAGYGFAGSGLLAGYKHYNLSKEREECEAKLAFALTECTKEASTDQTKTLELKKLQDASESLPGIEKIEDEIEFSDDHSDKLTKSVDEFLAKIKENKLACKESAVPTCDEFVKDYKAGLNRCSDAMKKAGKSDEIPGKPSDKKTSFQNDHEEMVREYFRLRGMNGFYDDVLNHLTKSESYGVLQLDAYIGLIKEILIPGAYAGFTEFLSLTGVGLAAYTGLKAEKTMFIDKYLSTYKNRAYVFGALSLLAFSASSETEGQIAKIDSNINKIDSILKSMAAGSGTQAPIGGGTSGPTYQPIQTPIVIPPQKEELPCANMDCEPVSEKIDTEMAKDPDLEKLMNIPESRPIVQSLKNVAALADDMKKSGNLSKASLDKLDDVGKQQNALSQAAYEMERKFKKENPNDNYHPFKLAQDEKLARNLSGNKVAINRAGTIVEEPVAQTQGSSLSQAQIKDKTSLMVNDVYYMPSVNSNKRESMGNSGVSEDLALEVDTEGALSKYNPSEADLASEDGPTLWTLITNRYLKSATEKLLVPKEDLPQGSSNK